MTDQLFAAPVGGRPHHVRRFRSPAPSRTADELSPTPPGLFIEIPDMGAGLFVGSYVPKDELGGSARFYYGPMIVRTEEPSIYDGEALPLASFGPDVFDYEGTGNDGGSLARVRALACRLGRATVLARRLSALLPPEVAANVLDALTYDGYPSGYEGEPPHVRRLFAADTLALLVQRVEDATFKVSVDESEPTTIRDLLAVNFDPMAGHLDDLELDAMLRLDVGASVWVGFCPVARTS